MIKSHQWASLSTIRSLRYWEKGFKTRIKWQYGSRLPWSVYVENLSDLLHILFQYHWHILGLSQNTTEHRICFSKTGWLADHVKALESLKLMSNRFFIGICKKTVGARMCRLCLYGINNLKFKGAVRVEEISEALTRNMNEILRRICMSSPLLLALLWPTLKNMKIE